MTSIRRERETDTNGNYIDTWTHEVDQARFNKERLAFNAARGDIFAGVTIHIKIKGTETRHGE